MGFGDSGHSSGGGSQVEVDAKLLPSSDPVGVAGDGLRSGVYLLTAVTLRAPDLRPVLRVASLSRGGKPSATAVVATSLVTSGMASPTVAVRAPTSPMGAAAAVGTAPLAKAALDAT